MKKDECIDRYEEIKGLLKNNSDDGKLWLSYATCLHGMSDKATELLVALEKAQILLPEKDLRYQIANAYINVGQSEKGITLINSVLNEKKTAKGFCFLAEAYYKLEEYEKAIEACNEAIFIDANYEEAYYLYAESIKFDSPEKAVIYYYKAIEIDPEFQESWAAAGKLLISLQDRIEEGIKCLETALLLDPNDGWSMIYLANGFWKNGDIEKADKKYKETIELFSDYPEVYKWYADFLNAQDSVEAELYYKKYKEMAQNS